MRRLLDSYKRFHIAVVHEVSTDRSGEWNAAPIVAGTVASMLLFAACTDNLVTPQESSDVPAPATAKTDARGETSSLAGSSTLVGAVTVTWGASAGVTTLPLESDISIGTDGFLTINLDGTFSLTPPSGIVQATISDFRYEFMDGGLPVTRAATITTTVAGAPALPTAAPMLATLSFHPGPGNDRTVFTAPTPLSISPNGLLGVNPSGSLRITPPDAFYSDGSLQYTISDWTEGTVGSVVIEGAGAPRVPMADQYTATGNIVIEHDAPGVLGNDDVGLWVTKVEGLPGNVGIPTSTTAIGRNAVTGTVTLASDGSFTYEPPPGVEGTDSFTYSTGDDPTETVNVTINVSTPAWFIDNSASGSNLGTFTNPFQSIADFNTANGTALGPDVGNVIALRNGNGTYSEMDGIDLLNDQRLIGEAVAFNSEFTGDANSSSSYQTFASGTSTAPVIEVTGVGDNGIDLGTDNTIRGLTVGDTDNSVVFGPGGHAMAGLNVGTLVVTDVSITGTGGALDLLHCDLNATFEELTSDASQRRGMFLSDCTGTLTVTNNASTITNAVGQAVVFVGGSVSMDYPGEVSQGVNTHHLIELLGTVGGDVMFRGTTIVTQPVSRSIKIDQSATNVTFADVDIGTPTVPISPMGPDQAGILISGNSTGTVILQDVNVYVTGAAQPGIHVDNTTFAGSLIINQGHFEARGSPALDLELTQVTLSSVTVGSTGGVYGVRLSDVAGSVDLDGTGVTGLAGPTNSGVDITHSAGTLSLNLESLTITDAGVSGVRIEAANTATVCLNLLSSSSTNHGSFGFVLVDGAQSSFQLQDFSAGTVEDWVAGKGNVGSVSASGSFTAAAGTCVP